MNVVGPKCSNVDIMTFIFLALPTSILPRWSSFVVSCQQSIPRRRKHTLEKRQLEGRAVPCTAPSLPPCVRLSINTALYWWTLLVVLVTVLALPVVWPNKITRCKQQTSLFTLITPWSSPGHSLKQLQCESTNPCKTGPSTAQQVSRYIVNKFQAKDCLCQPQRVFSTVVYRWLR